MNGYCLYFLPTSFDRFTGEMVEIQFRGGIRAACRACAKYARKIGADVPRSQSASFHDSMAVLVDPDGKAIATISPQGHHIWLPVPLKLETVLKGKPADLPLPGRSPSFFSRGPAIGETTSKARTRKWVPHYSAPGKPDLYYINETLSALWREPDGTLPRHGNPESPLDDLVYLMLSRRGRIDEAQSVFESLRNSVTPNGAKEPDWSRLLKQPIKRLSARLSGLGMGHVRGRELHRVLTTLTELFGSATLDPLHRWSDRRCLEFLSSLSGVGPKTAQCVMLYSLGRKVFPADTHCIRVLARLGVIPLEFEDQARHKQAQRLLADGRIPPDLCYNLHVTLIRHGQEICTPQNPKCHCCPLRGFCARYRAERRGEWEKKKSQPAVVDLFSGAGGTSLGLSRPVEYGHSEQAAHTRTLRIAFAAENDKWAIKSYYHNHPELPEDRVQLMDLTAPDATEKIKKAVPPDENVVLVVGGPPCQGFSLIGTTGRRTAKARPGNFAARNGNETYRAFRDIVLAYGARFFVMENVPAILAAHDSTAWQEIEQDFASQYEADHLFIDAHKQAGTPQRRKRVVIVGVRRGREGKKKAQAALSFLIEKLSSTLPRAEWVATFGEAVSDLPVVQSGEGFEFSRWPQSSDVPTNVCETTAGSSTTTQYQRIMRNNSPLIYNHVARPNNARDLQLYELLQPGEVGRDAICKYNRPGLMIYRNDVFDDKYRRQVWDAPSTTIVAHLAKDGHMFIHPLQTRSITVREAARLQSFPDDFIFFGPRTAQFRQVGNAVPPLDEISIRRPS
jgi:DNA (cytosine-5)-methyltransferase 1